MIPSTIVLCPSSPSFPISLHQRWEPLTTVIGSLATFPYLPSLYSTGPKIVWFASLRVRNNVFAFDGPGQKNRVRAYVSMGVFLLARGKSPAVQEQSRRPLGTPRIICLTTGGRYQRTATASVLPAFGGRNVGLPSLLVCAFAPGRVDPLSSRLEALFTRLISCLNVMRVFVTVRY